MQSVFTRPAEPVYQLHACACMHTALCEGSAYNGIESPTVLVVITPSALRRHEDTLSGNKCAADIEVRSTGPLSQP